jgi:ribosome-associated protein
MPDQATKPKLSPEQAVDLAIEVILDRKGTDVLVLDISKCSDLADSMLICTARNPRQAQALAHHLSERLKAAGLKRLSMAGLENGSWVVLDYGDLFVHVMLDDVRRFYDLEALWGDAEVVRRVAGERAAADGAEKTPAESRRRVGL